jgi:prepilin-type N-terminal cleavage/methylation domain-containing protein
MPISATGNSLASSCGAGNSARSRLSAGSGRLCGRRGVTLMELMVVLVIITLIVGISFPSTIAGMENLRLSAGARSVAAFMNVAANRAERRQQAIELSISVKDNTVIMQSAEGGFVKRLGLPSGITVQAVWPALSEPSDEPRRFLLQPGGVPPRIGIEIANRRGGRRIVRLNPVTGVTEIEQP